jgi:S-adenosylmethionine hydrolase
MIILLTDFGQGEYVGVMKGVIYSVNPNATIVDLCHDISPQSIIEASWILKNNYSYFPDGSVFCCVVDPGVGSERKALAVKTKRSCFVAPDNGLLWETLNDQDITEIRELSVPENASRTFHGRDVFAKAAAEINLNGFENLGRVLSAGLKKIEILYEASVFWSVSR